MQVKKNYLILFFTFLVLAGNCVYAQKTPQVWKLEIKGNKTFSDVIIKQQIATEDFSVWEKTQFWDRKGHPLNRLKLKKDVIRIQNFYQHRGFPFVEADYKIIKEEGGKRKIVFSINEGNPIVIDQVDIIFNSATQRRIILNNEIFIEAKSNANYKQGKRYDPVKKYQVENHFKTALKEIGFAYAKVNVNAEIDSAARAAHVLIHINTGPRTVLKKINVKGAQTLSEKYIIRGSGLELGSLYNTEEIEEAQRQLYDHPLIKFVTIRIPHQPRDSTLQLVINIREKEPRTVELSLGFSTEEYLRGRVSWIHRNAFGQAHRFSATAKASFIEQFLGLNYLFPYVFNTRSSFLISPFAQHLLRPAYELYRWGVTNSLIYRYSRDLTASISYQFTQNDEVARRFDVKLPDTTKTYDLSSIQLSALYSKGLRLIDRGWVIQPFIQLSGLLGTSDYQFQKLSLDIRRYISITPSTVLALRVQGGKIFAAQEDSLPRSVRLNLGGSNSVRGWGRHELGPKVPVFENKKGERIPAFSPNASFDRYIPVGGRTSFAFNIEIRQDLNKLIKGFGFVVFLDGGQVWRRDVNLTSRPLQFGIGGGFRYRSPVGPVRLDIGYKLNPSSEDLSLYKGANYGTVWDRFGIYLSIGQAF